MLKGINIMANGALDVFKNFEKKNQVLVLCSGLNISETLC